MEKQILTEQQKLRRKKAEALVKALNDVAALLEPGQQIDDLGDLGLILKRTDRGFAPHPDYVNEGKAGKYRSPFNAHRIV